MRSVVTVALLISLIPASVLADPKSTDPSTMVTPQEFPRTNEARVPALDPLSSVADDCALARKAKKTCVLVVPAEDVGGRVPAVGDLAVRVLTFGTAASLIRVRRDFIPAIVKAAEDM